MKGDGEAHPYLSPNDEFADYELWDKGNLDASVAKKKEMLEFEYTRSALKYGLMLEAKLGVNPYKFGRIAHLVYAGAALSEAREERSSDRARQGSIPAPPALWSLNS